MGLLKKERWRGHVQPGPARPVLVGLSHRQCWGGKLRGPSATSPKDRWGREGTWELAAYKAVHSHLLPRHIPTAQGHG